MRAELLIATNPEKKTRLKRAGREVGTCVARGAAAGHDVRPDAIT
jgi:hypothetical protein